MRREEILNLSKPSSIECSGYSKVPSISLTQLTRQATREALEHEKIREAIQTDRLTAAK